MKGALVPYNSFFLKILFNFESDFATQPRQLSPTILRIVYESKKSFVMH